jgi:hypothetical protein
MHFSVIISVLETLKQNVNKNCQDSCLRLTVMSLIGSKQTLTYITGAKMSVFDFVKSWSWCRVYGFDLTPMRNKSALRISPVLWSFLTVINSSSFVSLPAKQHTQFFHNSCSLCRLSSPSYPVYSATKNFGWLKLWLVLASSGLAFPALFVDNWWDDGNPQLTFGKIGVRKISIRLQLNERDMIRGFDECLTKAWFRKDCCIWNILFSTILICSSEYERRVSPANLIVSSTIASPTTKNVSAPSPSLASTLQNTHGYPENSMQPEISKARHEVRTMHRTRTSWKFRTSCKTQVSMFSCINSLKSK